MKILILGLNYAPEKVGIATYTSGLAEHIAASGHQVRVISGQPYYPAWKVMDGYPPYGFSRGRENGVYITRVPHYVPANPTGAKRLLHHASFALTSFFPAIWSGLTWRPDIVFTIAPSLIATPVARLAALVGGARSWLHIQDFEVEAAFATGLLSGHGSAARFARWVERVVFAMFDMVSTISPQMCRKLAEKKVPPDRIVEFRNWADIDAIRPMSGPSPFRAEWGIDTPYVALYSGNIANKQGIEIIVEAARLLSHRDDLTFVICGEGPNRSALERLAGGLRNIQFHDLQAMEKLNDLLGLATIHLLPQKADAADLVLPSKLANMLASGRPVIATAAMGTGLADEVEGCGIITPPEDAKAYAKAIESILADKAAYAQISGKARRRAESRWEKGSIVGGLERRFSQFVRKRQ